MHLGAWGLRNQGQATQAEHQRRGDCMGVKPLDPPGAGLDTTYGGLLLATHAVTAGSNSQ